MTYLNTLPLIEWCPSSLVANHELGGGGVEGWPSRQSPAEDPGDRGSAGQAEEGKDAETVSARLFGGRPAKAETKGHCSRRDCIAHTEFNARVTSAKTVVLNHSFGNAIRRYTKLLKGVFIVYMSLASGGQ